MSQVNIFERASRIALRFDTDKGPLSVEDLWRLPLQSGAGRPSLDSIGMNLRKELAESENAVQSLVPESAKSPSAQDGWSELQLMFDIVKHIIDVRVAERDAKQKADLKKAERQKLLGLIADAEDERLRGLSPEELRQRLSTLDDETN